MPRTKHLSTGIRKVVMGKNNMGILLLLALLVALHIPFLTADLDLRASNYQSPYSDEGLYSAQIRNLIDNGDLTVKSTDGLVKTPLLSGILCGPYRIFGTSLAVGRSTVLLISLLLLLPFFLNRDTSLNLFKVLVLLIPLFEFHIFHFFHLSLSEAISSSFIFLSIYVLYRVVIGESHMIYTLLAALLVSCAYYVKIQFAYVVAILPIALIMYYVLEKSKRKSTLKIFVWVCLTLFLCGVLFILAWYLPQKEMFDYVLGTQTSGGFVGYTTVLEFIPLYFQNVFNTPELLMFTIFFAVLWVVGMVLLFKQPDSKKRFLYIGMSAWFLMELHKLLMLYHPTRYIISLLFVMGVLMALSLSMLWDFSQSKRWRNLIRLVIGLVITVISLQNLGHYVSAFKRRTYVVKEANAYLAQYNLKGKLALGARAAMLCWDCKAITMPVWEGYFNDRNAYKLKPYIIVEDAEQTASQQAFKNQGINLNAISDSVKHFKVGVWEANVYWINQDSIP